MDWRRWRNVCARTDACEPLRVTVRLAAPVAGPHPWLHLDALLAFQALHETHHPDAKRPFSPTSASQDIIDVPLPLRRAGDIWACSCLWPEDELAPGRVAWTMRPATEHMTLVSARQLALTHGAYARRREHLLVWPAPVMVGFLVGQRRWVERLLARVGAVGKKRSQGYGVVREITVDPCEEASVRWRVHPDGTAARPLPHPDGVRMGVRPPYWYRPWWQPAVGPGEQL